MVRDNLTVIADEAAQCTACPLHLNRNLSVFSSGSAWAKVMCIGEAGGKTENLQGLPFVGKAGKLLNNMLASIGLDRRSTYITNVCKCAPPNNRKPTDEEMVKCKPFLDRQIDVVQPKIIIALGNTAVVGLLGPGLGITKRRGKWEKYKNIDVMPSLHPAALLRNPLWKKDSWEDFQLIKGKLDTL